MEEKIIKEMPELTISDICSAYRGKPNKCRCGCSGTYYYTEINRDYATRNRGYKVTDDEISDETVQRILNRMKKFAHLGVEVLHGKNEDIYSLVIGKTEYSLYVIRVNNNE